MIYDLIEKYIEAQDKIQDNYKAAKVPVFKRKISYEIWTKRKVSKSPYTVLKEARERSRSNSRIHYNNLLILFFNPT